MIIVMELARLQMQAAAAQAYPLEANGELLGEHSGFNTKILAVHIHQPKKSTRSSNMVDDESDARVQDYLEHMNMGNFHSHPDQYPTMSRMRDRKEESDEEMMLYDYFDGAALVISGIWPGKKLPWIFRWKAYETYLGKIRRTEIRFI